MKNYTPQTTVRQQKIQARLAWGVAFVIGLVWISLILSAPLAKEFGFTGFADPVYKFFGYLCHQMPSRSFHIHENQFAVCTRCFGFYGGFFLGIVLYPFVRNLRDTEPLPRFWLFAAMIPMGVDWSLTFFDVWENTAYSRFFTGLILGAACAFFIVPAFVEIGYWFGEKFQPRTRLSASKFGVD
jgi:uncharacterized membrane protein